MFVCLNDYIYCDIDAVRFKSIILISSSLFSTHLCCLLSLALSTLMLIKYCSRNNEGMEPKQKQHLVVDVTGDRSKIRCCKDQYSIGTWNVRSINQGKLEVVKQEMERVNVNILGSVN